MTCKGIEHYFKWFDGQLYVICRCGKMVRCATCGEVSPLVKDGFPKHQCFDTVTENMVERCWVSCISDDALKRNGNHDL